MRERPSTISWRNSQTAGQRGNIDARLQRRGDRLSLELIRPPAPLADRRTVQPLNKCLDQLQATSRRHRRRTSRRHGTPAIRSTPQAYSRPATRLSHGVPFPLTIGTALPLHEPTLRFLHQPCIAQRIVRPLQFIGYRHRPCSSQEACGRLRLFFEPEMAETFLIAACRNLHAILQAENAFEIYHHHGGL